MTGKLNTMGDRIEELAEAFRDNDIELQVVAYLLRKDSFLSTYISATWFTDVILKDLFSIVSELKMTMTKAMVMDELKVKGVISKKGERELYEDTVDKIYVVDISVLNEKSVRHLVERLLNLYESRNILAVCGGVLLNIRKFDLNVAKQKLKVCSRPVSVSFQQSSSGFYLDDYDERKRILEDRKREAEELDSDGVGIPTGIYPFDHMVGGIMRKEFGLIAGRPGIGKTAALIGFAVYAWLRGFDVCLCSGEMAKVAMGFRVDSYLTQIPGMKFRKADLTDKEYKLWDNAVSLYRAKTDNFLYIGGYSQGFTIEDIERDYQYLYEETGRKVDFVGVDYLNIMDTTSEKTYRDTWQSQRSVVWDFKDFVGEYDLVGWSPNQIVDAAYEKELYSLSDLKYGRAIAEAAPIVIALIQSEKDEIENRMKFQILKMREAEPPKKPIALTPRLDIMRIHQDTGSKTLRGLGPSVLDTNGGLKRKKRPRRRVKGV